MYTVAGIPPTQLDSAAITEIGIFFEPASPTQNTTNAFNSAFANLKAAVAAAAGNVYTVSGDIQGEEANPEGQETNAVLAFVGWQSMEAREAFDQTAAFADAIGGLVPYFSGTTGVDVPFKRLI